MGFGGHAIGKGTDFTKRRKGWVCVKVVAQSGTGSSMCVVRHERDPKVITFEKPAVIASETPLLYF